MFKRSQGCPEKLTLSSARRGRWSKISSGSVSAAMTMNSAIPRLRVLVAAKGPCSSEIKRLRKLHGTALLYERCQNSSLRFLCSAEATCSHTCMSLWVCSGSQTDANPPNAHCIKTGDKGFHNGQGASKRSTGSGKAGLYRAQETSQEAK